MAEHSARTALILCGAGGLIAACLSACGEAQPPAPDAQDQPETYTMEDFGLPVTRSYRCANGVTLSVRITQTPHRAQVSVDGGIPANLNGVVSGSGAKFEASGMVFHAKGREAIWGDFLKDETRCVEQAL